MRMSIQGKAGWLISRFLFLLLLSSSGSGCESKQPQAPDTDAVHPTLLANVASVKPGEKFRLGALIKIDAPSHIYWRYPGDAGLPTRMTLKSPEGFKASVPSFPLPEKFVQPGEITGYGYNTETFVSIEVSTPAEIAGTSVELVAELKWLACSNVCVPGKISLPLSLPVGDGAPVNRELFDGWDRRSPVLAGEAGEVEAINVRAVQMAEAGGEQMEAVVSWRGPQKDVLAIPAEYDRAEFGPVVVKNEGAETRFLFDFKRQGGVGTLDNPLEVLIMYGGSGESRKGFFLPLKQD
jgi:DsbC/DsbD-like thiol-disulfide interchange protein